MFHHTPALAVLALPLGYRGCCGPRCRVLPLWESSAQPDLLSANPECQPKSALVSCPRHCTLRVNLIHAVNYQAQQSQRSSHHSEVATEVWFCSPLSPFLLSFNLPLSFFLCVAPCAPSPSFTCLLMCLFPQFSHPLLSFSPIEPP